MKLQSIKRKWQYFTCFRYVLFYYWKSHKLISNCLVIDERIAYFIYIHGCEEEKNMSTINRPILTVYAILQNFIGDFFLLSSATGHWNHLNIGMEFPFNRLIQIYFNGGCLLNYMHGFVPGSISHAGRAVKACVHAWYVLSLSQTARLKQGNVAAMALQLSTPNGTASGYLFIVGIRRWNNNTDISNGVF